MRKFLESFDEAKRDVWYEGASAYVDGVPLIANPYPPNDPKSAEWDGGWEDAHDDDLKRKEHA